jgi:hypothetical protein
VGHLQAGITSSSFSSFFFSCFYYSYYSAALTTTTLTTITLILVVIIEQFTALLVPVDGVEYGVFVTPRFGDHIFKE